MISRKAFGHSRTRPLTTNAISIFPFTDMDRLYITIRKGIDYLPSTGNMHNFSYTRSCFYPILEKAKEHATEEEGLCAGIFTSEMNLFRCFMRFLFRDAHTEEERDNVAIFVYPYSYMINSFIMDSMVSFENMKSA